MSQAEASTSLPIEFAVDTFPIIGTTDQQLIRYIHRERMVALDDLKAGGSYQINIRYDHDPDKSVYFDKLRISRKGGYIILEAIDQSSGDTDTVITTARIFISRLLSVAKMYAEYKESSDEAIRALAQAGRKLAIQRLDLALEFLHATLDKVIENNLENQPIHIGYNPDKMRFITTAIMMHILPANVFNDRSLVSEGFTVKEWAKPKPR